MPATVDGRNPAPAEYLPYPIIYKVLYIPGGAGFFPSTVSLAEPVLRLSTPQPLVAMFFPNHQMVQLSEVFHFSPFSTKKGIITSPEN